MPATLKSDFVFQIFAERLQEEPELAKKMKVVYHWNIMQSGKKISEWSKFDIFCITVQIKY